MNHNVNNTNVRSNESKLTNKQVKDFCVRMVLDPEFVSKYGGLSDDIIKSIEVDYKREEYDKNQTRGSKRNPLKKNQKKLPKITPESSDSEEEDLDQIEAHREAEIRAAVTHIPLRIKPTPKYSNYSPYAPQMADPTELSNEVQGMELSE